MGQRTWLSTAAYSALAATVTVAIFVIGCSRGWISVELTAAETGELADVAGLPVDKTLSSDVRTVAIVGDASRSKRLSRTPAVRVLPEPPFSDSLNIRAENGFQSSTDPLTNSLPEPTRTAVVAKPVLDILTVQHLGNEAQSQAGARLSAVDLDGQFRVLGASLGCRAVAVVFLSPACGYCSAYLPELNRIATSGRSFGIEVFGVLTGESATTELARKYRQEQDIQFPLLVAQTESLMDHLRPTHTPHAFVLTPSGEVMYEGRIDNRLDPSAFGRVDGAYLLHALQAVHSRTRPLMPSTLPVGTPLIPAPAAFRNGD